MSVYRFKSRETGDLVMLEQHGKRMIEIMGKDPEGPGIVQPGEMPAAVEAIRAAVTDDEARKTRLTEEAQKRGDAAPSFDPVSLRMRSAPLIEMLQRCEKAGVEMVWGV